MNQNPTKAVTTQIPPSHNIRQVKTILCKLRMKIKPVEVSITQKISKISTKNNCHKKAQAWIPMNQMVMRQRASTASQAK